MRSGGASGLSATWTLQSLTGRRRAGASGENRCPRRPRRALRDRLDGCWSARRDQASAAREQPQLQGERSRRLGLRQQARVADERLVNTFARSTPPRPKAGRNAPKLLIGLLAAAVMCLAYASLLRSRRGGRGERRKQRPWECSRATWAPFRTALPSSPSAKARNSTRCRKPSKTRRVTRWCTAATCTSSTGTPPTTTTTTGKRSSTSSSRASTSRKTASATCSPSTGSTPTSPMNQPSTALTSGAPPPTPRPIRRKDVKIRTR